MPVLRLMLGALVAFVAICATLFAAAIVVFTGFVGYVLQLFRPKSAARAPRNATQPHRPRHAGDAIDVVATEVSGKQ